jgi:sugar O-acyltransferase (sialic acid O-acetyltransferase NeuD family)
LATKNLLIYGCGYPSITSLIKYLNKRGEKWNIIGYLDDTKFGNEKEYYGYPIIGNESSIPEFVQKGYYFFNNVASSTMSIEAVAQKLAKHNTQIVTFIFPELPDLDPDTINVCEGSLISPQVIVGAGVRLGKNVIVRQQAIISHDSTIGNYCFVGPNTGIMGGVTIGDKTFVGAKALIRENVRIGDNCVIGMGAVVTKDVPNNTTIIGNPAKPVQSTSTNSLKTKFITKS